MINYFLALGCSDEIMPSSIENGRFHITDWLKDNGTWPGNAAAFDAMKCNIAEGNAVAIVGAGASAPIYPVWAPFLDGLIDNARADGLSTIRIEQLRTQTHRALYLAEELERERKSAFYTYIDETFGHDRNPPAQTKTHEALMRLPFAAYVTINYDIGLTEARRKITRFVSYHDMNGYGPKATNRWCGGVAAAFSSGEKEILHLHGRFNEPNDIVLTLAQYQRAYETSHKRILESLWKRQGLVLVGYGFADPWINFIASNALIGLARDRPHFALIGVPEDTWEERAFYERTYGLRPIFYPVRPDHDHSALHETLDALGLYGYPAPLPPEPSTPGPTSTPPRHPARREPVIPEKFVHQTTDDEHYTGREDVLVQLDDLAASTDVRVAAITGVGGIGKTALVGRWLKHGRGHLARKVEGLFVWSFYVNKSFANLADGLFTFAEENFGWTPDETKVDEYDNAALRLLRFFRAHAVCLVLDGLEMIQGDRGLERYGLFLDPDLAKLLGGLAEMQPGLALLTSRFPFADLIRFRGIGFTEIHLPRLSPEEGADLLNNLHVRAERDALKEASGALQGHALALRILAAAARRGNGNLPDLASMSGLLGADKFSKKMERLLAFYAEILPEADRRLASIVSLFPSAVPRSVLTTLTDALDDPNLPKGPALDTALVALGRDGLLLREPGIDSWSAHPIVRDHFRAVGGMAAEKAADLIAGRPSASRVTNIDDIRGALDAIIILCDAGHFAAAWSLYRRHCEGGVVFSRLTAVRDAYRIESRFTREEARDQLSDREQSLALFNAAKRAEKLGDPVRATEMFDRSARMDEAREDWRNAAVARRFRSDTLWKFRPVAEAVEEAVRALALAEKTDNQELLPRSHATLARCLVYAGQSAAAAEHLGAGRAAAVRLGSLFDELGFHYDAGIVLFHLDRADLAAALFSQDAENQTQRGYLQTAKWSEGRAAEMKGNAAARLAAEQQALEIARGGGDMLEMTASYIRISESYFDLHHANKAEDFAHRAVEAAAPRGFIVHHADALVARANALTALGQGEAARIASQDALNTNRPLGNVVIERKAWRARARAAAVLDDTVLEAQARAEATRIDAMLIWPEGIEFAPLGLVEDAK